MKQVIVAWNKQTPFHFLQYLIIKSLRFLALNYTKFVTEELRVQIAIRFVAQDTYFMLSMP